MISDFDKIEQTHPNQITIPQRVILEKLANLFGYNNCKFLEIGSWLGDSTTVLGNVLKKFNGTLVCIDNWKGSPTTVLDEISKKNDIHGKFRKKIIESGLSDNIITIIADSEVAANYLKNRTFDFTFLDADHRYKFIKNDIINYLPKSKKDAFFCGHDCEGYFKDYDEKIINMGLNCDVYNNIHCGVIKAVDELIPNVFIYNQIFMKTFYKDNNSFNKIFSELKLNNNNELIFLNKDVLIEQNGKDISIFYLDEKVRICNKKYFGKSFYFHIFKNNLENENNLFLSVNPVLVFEEVDIYIIYFSNKFYVCPKSVGRIDFFKPKKNSYYNDNNIKIFDNFLHLYKSNY